MNYFLSIILIVIVGVPAFSQKNIETKYKTIDSVITELLDQITIENGEKIDSAVVRQLFHSKALLTVADSTEAESISIDDFLVLLKDPYYEEGYVETEIHKVVDEYNGIAQVFQNFYGKDSEGIEEKGINSYQLTKYRGRWWIVSLLWTMESYSKPIPNKYGGG